MNQRFLIHAAVYLILIQDQKVLLIRRANTGWMDGKYTFPAGHLEPGELVTDCMAREAQEEVGLTIQPEDLTVVHSEYSVSDQTYANYYLTATKWDGEASVCEPDKCDDIQWFDIENLPENVIPHVRRVLAYYKQGVTFNEVKSDEY